MEYDQADQFGSGIAAGARDSDSDFSHSNYQRIASDVSSPGFEIAFAAKPELATRNSLQESLIAVGIKKGKAEAFPLCDAGFGNYRFEYWNRFLAPFWPYFFRSFTLESRVSRPSFLRGARSG